MATTNVGFSVTVESNDATKSIKELRSEIDQTTQAVQELGQQYGENSKEVEAAQKRLLQLQDLTNQKQEENNRRIDNAAKTITALSAAYGGVQGALELTGLAGEDTIKQLAKIQSALAIGDAVQNLAEFKDAISSTFGEFRNTAVKAFQAVKGAIGATGIGLLIVSLGLVAANFDKIKKAVLEFIPGLNQVGKIFTSIVQKVTDFVGITSQAERALASLEKTTKRTNEGLESRIKILTAQGGKEKEIYELTKKQGENELNALRSRLATTGKLTEEEQKRFRELGVERQVLDAQEQKRRADNAKQAAETAKGISDKLAEEESAKIEKRIADEKKLTEDTLAEYDKRRRIANDAKILTQKEIAKLDAEEKKKKEEEDNKKFDAQKEYLSKTTNYTIQKYNEDQKLKQELRDAELKADIELQNAKFDAASAGINLLSSLAGENEKLANILFIADKALAIAKIVVNTQAEISSIALANSKFGAAGIPLTIAQSTAAKIRAGIGIASIAATTIAKFKGGGSAGSIATGGSSAPSVSAAAPIAPPQPQTTTLSSQTINAIGNQAVRAYVVENDVTSNQQRIAAIQQRARFG
jgi:hypothetical protein